MIEEKIRDLLSHPISDAGYILDSVTYGKEGTVNTLTIVVDKDGGYITVGDCVNINGIIDPLLDEADLISESYVLDVCSKEKGSD